MSRLRKALKCLLLLLLLVTSSFNQIDLAHSQQKHADPLLTGYKLFQKGELSAALRFFQQAERSYGVQAQITYQIAHIYYAQKRDKKARQAYETALKILPSEFRPRLLNNIGNIYFRSKKYHLAVQYYSQALAKNASYERARFNLELALRKLQDKRKKRSKPKPRNQNKKQSKPPPPANKKPPPPPRKNPSEGKKRMTRKLRPPKPSKVFLPESKRLDLKYFDQFLPYSRILRYKKNLKK